MDWIGLPTLWSERVGDSPGALFTQPGDPFVGYFEGDTEDGGGGFRGMIELFHGVGRLNAIERPFGLAAGGEDGGADLADAEFEAGLDGAERDAGLGGDLPLAEAAKVGEFQGLALAIGQSGEDFAQHRATLGYVGIGLDCAPRRLSGAAFHVEAHTLFRTIVGLAAEVGFDFLKREIVYVAASKRGSQHIWLWLTKIPKRMAEFGQKLESQGVGWPDNLVAMTTVTSQKTAIRATQLKAVPARFKGLSVEPLWEEVTLPLEGIDWCIVGGQSGSGSKPFDLAWAESVIEQCKAPGTAMFMKQLGKR